MSEQETYVFVCDSTNVENGSEAVFEINDREVLVVRSTEESYLRSKIIAHMQMNVFLEEDLEMDFMHAPIMVQDLSYQQENR